ncbi:hypothetical protein [Lewinella sp. LCG006]|uniref:hypothetical protein n=1 Tax=Lewinella sp. LCG006 TaxID=3231911 RepID=UPI0034602FF1
MKNRGCRKPSAANTYLMPPIVDLCITMQLNKITSFSSSIHCFSIDYSFPIRYFRYLIHKTKSDKNKSSLPARIAHVFDLKELQSGNRVDVWLCFSTVFGLEDKQEIWRGFYSRASCADVYTRNGAGIPKKA